MELSEVAVSLQFTTIASLTIRGCSSHQPHIILTCADLLSKVKDLGDVSTSDLVRSCGYASTKRKTAGSRPCRQLNYPIKVQCNGNLLVSKAYTAHLGLDPGDDFEIKLGRKQIKRIPLGAVEEE